MKAGAFGIFQLAGDLQFLAKNSSAFNRGADGGIGVLNLSGDLVAGEAFTFVELAYAGGGCEVAAFGLAAFKGEIEDERGLEFVRSTPDDAVAGVAGVVHGEVDIGKQ